MVNSDMVIPLESLSKKAANSLQIQKPSRLAGISLRQVFIPSFHHSRVIERKVFLLKFVFGFAWFRCNVYFLFSCCGASFFLRSLGLVTERCLASVEAACPSQFSKCVFLLQCILHGMACAVPMCCARAHVQVLLHQSPL
jgi:hypothetical protein